jgi:hypothetical protein
MRNDGPAQKVTWLSNIHHNAESAEDGTLGITFWAWCAERTVRLPAAFNPVERHAKLSTPGPNGFH